MQTRLEISLATRSFILPDDHHTRQHCFRCQLLHPLQYKPRSIHEIALKWIIKYLLMTPTQGMVYRPDRTKGLKCYVDANFAGNFRRGDPKRASCLSRSGYIIMYYNNCTLIWASKLQTSVYLSTCEAEYIQCPRLYARSSH
jgi:hypothetical protein